MNPQRAERRGNARASVALILAAAALALVPELLRGNSCGHDFDFHFVSWFDALNGWRHGILYPHWTPSANFGAGEPRFVFYSPLTWMLGAALGAVLPWSLVPTALTFVLLAGTGLATRALARDALNEGAATLAGCIAIFSGYPLFTSYERSAFAELAGGLWIPLVILFALRNREDWIASGASWKRIFNGSVVPLAIVIAGSWLSNPTVGVMACYLLAALAIVSAWLYRSWWPAIRAAFGAALGMGLSAFYLLPAAWEQRWVDIQQVTENPGQTLENNWLFTRHADPALALHDQVLHTASWIVLGMVVLTVGALLVCKLRGRLRGLRSWWIPLAFVPVVVLLLQFSFTDPLWNHLPELRFLQFPWRWLLVLEAPMAVFLAAAVWPRKHSTRSRIITVAISLAVFASVTAAANGLLYQTCYPEDTAPGMLAVLETGVGYNGTNEYKPFGADISLIPMRLPQACFMRDPGTALGKANDDGDLAWDASQPGCETTYAATETSGPEHLRIDGTTPQSGYLMVRRISYPAWRVKLNGHAVEARPARADGLMAVPVPQGPFALSVDWTTTRDVIAARCLSGLSVLLLTLFYLFERRCLPHGKFQARSFMI